MKNVAILILLALASCQAIAGLLGSAGAPVSDATKEKAQAADEAGWSFVESLVAGLLGLGGVGAAAKGTHVVVKRRRAKKEACAKIARDDAPRNTH